MREAGAVAGVNGDFFDINNSNAAIGPEILGGAIRKSGIGRTQVAGVSENRLGRLANLALEATATLPSGPRAVRSLNDPTDVGANNIAAYTPLWGVVHAHPRRPGLNQHRRGDRHRRQGRVDQPDHGRRR